MYYTLVSITLPIIIIFPGQSLHKLGQLHEAENWFQAALTEKPDHIPAHLTYARLLSQQSRTIEAEELYKNALRIEPDNHTIYHHLGS